MRKKIDVMPGLTGHPDWIPAFAGMTSVTSFIVCFFVLGILIFSSASYAVTTYTDDLLKIGVGARPMGMGKAYVSVAEGVDGIFSNPAGLSLEKNLELTSMYTSLFEGDLNYILMGVSNPFDFGSVGLGAIATGTSQIPSPSPTTITYFDYYDRLFLLSYALPKPLDINGNKLFTGLNLKYFTKGFSDPVKKEGVGINADLGMKLSASNGLDIGLNLENFLPTQVVWNTGAADDIPMTAKLGLSKVLLDDKLLVSLASDIALKRNIPAPLHLGCEYSFNKYLALRAGIDQNISAGSVVVSNLTAGIGINISSLHIDYAYHPYSEGALNVAHYVSLSFK